MIHRQTRPQSQSPILLRRLPNPHNRPWFCNGHDLAKITERKVISGEIRGVVYFYNIKNCHKRTQGYFQSYRFRARRTECSVLAYQGVEDAEDYPPSNQSCH